jgi:dTDP-4-amino-4,6-dideoxygalactose transaminase
LADVPGVKPPASRPNSVHARHLFPIWVDAAKRDQLIGELSKRRI